MVLDYSLVPQVRIDNLKGVQFYIQKQFPDASYWEIAQALKRAGMKFPRSASV